jgi:TIR domain/Tetratricopeptide repeat
VPGPSSQGIFLSYRREDAAPYARLLQFQLRERFPAAQVFIDLDSIEAGLPFAKVIRDAVDTCTVLVALIGRQWMTITDEDGSRRLDNPRDYVRFEVQTALERGVRVIPVLVDGARPPREQQLPAELQELAELNALELSYGRYEYDAGRLLDLVQRVLTAAGDPAAADPQAVEEAGRQAREEPDRKGQSDAGPKTPVAADRTAREEVARQVEEETELRVLQEQALSAWKAGDVVGARDQSATLVSVAERALGPEHPTTLEARSSLARRTGEAGDKAAARDQGAALVPVAEQALGPEHPTTLDARGNLARWTGEAGDRAAARDQLAALVPVYDRVLGPEHPETLTARHNLAVNTGNAGAPTQARDQLAALVPVYDRVLGPEHPETLIARHNLAHFRREASMKKLNPWRSG